MPTWPERSIPPSPHSPQKHASRPPLRKQEHAPSSAPARDMSLHPSSPWSPPFSPTLGSIAEVFEYEPLESTSNTTTPNETHEASDAFVPEPSTIAEPKLSRARVKQAIIQSPLRRTVSALSVSKVLRKVLDADRARRRRIMRVYLKAIVFLKYIWRANERYGSVMLTSGMYLQR
ncbi:Nn.00g096250.m01.CDS01 [Neocucurbitaria sp. VM-36]